eukprot:COSAG06_NODE_30127_length_543_cov_0.856180_1_plen_44_part_10
MQPTKRYRVHTRNLLFATHRERIVFKTSLWERAHVRDPPFPPPP